MTGHAAAGDPDSYQPWHTEPMLGFDLETTHADPNHARIVTASIVVVNDGLTRVHTWLAKPGNWVIPEESTAIHGITHAHADEHGQPRHVVIAAVFDALKAWLRAGRPVVAMNAAYDFTVLDRECRRHRITALGAPAPVIDPYVIDKYCDPWRKGKRTLTALCDHYGVRVDGDAHDSATDALAALRVAWRLAARYPGMQLRLLELHAHQVGWRAEQQSSLAGYFTRRDQATEAAGVSPEWPVQGIPRDWDQDAFPVAGRPVAVPA